MSPEPYCFTLVLRPATLDDAGLLGAWSQEPHVICFGTQMMRLALQQCFADVAVAAIVIDPLASNARAIEFYARLGFKFSERRRFDDDDCLVHRLTREDWPTQPGSRAGDVGAEKQPG